MRIRKCAYYLPQTIRDLLSPDGDLVALGRAREQLVQEEDSMRQTDVGRRAPGAGDETDSDFHSDPDTETSSEAQTQDQDQALEMNVQQGVIGEECVAEFRISYASGKELCCYAAARGGDPARCRYGVSRISVFTAGLDQPDQLALFTDEEQALTSPWADSLRSAGGLARMNAQELRLTRRIRISPLPGDDPRALMAELRLDGEDLGAPAPSREDSPDSSDSPASPTALYLYGQIDEDGEFYAASAQSILSQMLDPSVAEDEEIPTLEEYTTLTGAMASEHGELYSLLHERLRRAREKG